MYAIILTVLMQEADFRQAFLEPVPVASAARANLKEVSVVVTVQDESGSSAGWGSGVLIKQGVLTCEHLTAKVAAGSKIICTYNDQDVLVSIEKSDRLMDLALLKLPETAADWPRAEVSEKPCCTGVSLRSCGRGVSGLITTEDHKFLRSNKTADRRELEFSNAPNTGRSGGGLFDEHDKLVGIVRSRNSVVSDPKSEPYGSAVAVDETELRRFLEPAASQQKKSPIGDTVSVREITVHTATWCDHCHKMQAEFEELYKSGKGDPKYRFNFVDSTRRLPVVYEVNSKTYRQALLPMSQWETESGELICFEGRISMKDLIQKIEFNDSIRKKP